MYLKPPTKMFKKSLITLFLSLFLFFTLGSAPAQASWYDQSYQDWVGQVYSESIAPTEIFGERYVAAQTQWVVYALAHMGVYWAVATVAGENGAKAADEFLSTGDTSDLILPPGESSTPTPTGQESLRSYLATVFQERPMSGITYFKNKFRNLSLIPEAHAQTATGFGFQALQPIQGLWRMARDISYSLFVLISIGLAFMIMFRVKLSPQVVISIQSALPKIAIGLILVTFSYAIAGFMIDLMYVVIGLIGLLIGGSNVADAKAIFEFCTEGLDFMGIGGFIGIMLHLLKMMLVVALAFISGVFHGANIGLTIVAVVTIIFFFIIALLATIRVFILIFKTFAMILILTIIAPLQITLGIIFPQVGFSLWFKSFASALAVFPAIGLFSLLALLFCISAINVSDNLGSWAPSIENSDSDFLPVINNLATNISFDAYEETTGWPPFLAANDYVFAFVLVMVSITLVGMLPKVSQILTAFIQGRGFSLESALTEAGQPSQMERGAWGYVGKPTWSRTGGAAWKRLRGKNEREAQQRLHNAQA